MFSAELLMKALGISPEMLNKYVSDITKGVEEIRAGIAGLINSNAAIIARLEAIERNLSSKDDNPAQITVQNAQLPKEENQQ